MEISANNANPDNSIFNSMQYVKIIYREQTITHPFHINDTFGLIQFSILRLLQLDYLNAEILFLQCRLGEHMYILGAELPYLSTRMSEFPSIDQNVEMTIRVIDTNETPRINMVDIFPGVNHLLNQSNNENNEYPNNLYYQIMTGFCRRKYEEYLRISMTQYFNQLYGYNIPQQAIHNNADNPAETPILFIRNLLNEQHLALYNYYTQMQHLQMQQQHQQYQPEYFNESPQTNNLQYSFINGNIEEDIRPPRDSLLEISFVMQNNLGEEENEDIGSESIGEDDLTDMTDTIDTIDTTNHFQQNLFDLLIEQIPIMPQNDVRIVMDEEDFDELPKMSYKQWKEQNTHPEYQPTECTICLEKFANQEEECNIVQMPQCIHIFHNECIKPWLLENSYKCPVCRQEQGEGNPIY